MAPVSSMPKSPAVKVIVISSSDPASRGRRGAIATDPTLSR
jgi:hypothetical protein